MATEMNRRQFVTGAAGVAAVGLAGAAMARAAQAEEAETSCTYADTIAWDGEYDVLVMGAGAAGSSAAYFAAISGANVLLFDVAPEAEAGGNTRYCGQIIFAATDKEKITTYLTSFYGAHEVPTEVLDAFTDGQLGMRDLLVEHFGSTPDEILSLSEMGYSAEYPEYEGTDALDIITCHQGVGDSELFRRLRKAVYAQSDKVDVWFEARGTKLIQDPLSKAVIGMQVERGGETLNVRAHNGVVMACGGFENNSRMLGDYLGIPTARPIGSAWNRGDGLRMALDVNADLWHMDAYEAYPNWGCGVAVDASVNDHAVSPSGIAVDTTGFETGSFFLAGPDGSRLMDETAEHRHGHLSNHGEWANPRTPAHLYMVFDQTQRDELGAIRLNLGVEDVMVSADTLEELATSLGMEEGALAASVERFGSFVEMGEDYEFGRPTDTMRAFDDGPYYALPMVPSVLNTQGGPRKNADACVLDVDGEPIPHLYCAGEFGGISARDYQGGTNICESITFGRIAGTNAAAPKDELPAYPGEAVESDVRFTVGSGSSDYPLPVREYELGENQYVGRTHIAMGGDLDVIVTMDGDAIASVEVVFDGETKGFGSYAVENFPQMIVEANSPDVDVITNCTMTCLGIADAVRDALSQVA